MFCRQCDYELRELDSRRCPECGRPFDPDNPKTWRRRPKRLAPRLLWAAAAAVLLLLYASAYLATVEIGTVVRPNRNRHPVQVFYKEPGYRLGGDFARVAFAPAHLIDRYIRPQRWAEEVWRNRHWSYPHYPRPTSFSCAAHGAAMRFRVEDPNTVQVWTMRFDPPLPSVDPAATPILVLRYRATNINIQNEWYVLWIDDGTGPNGHGLNPIRPGNLIDDGQVHEFRTDLRPLNPQGDLFFFAIGVAADAAGQAQLDVLEIRFEPAPSP